MKVDEDPIYRKLPKRPLVETVTPIVLLTETDSQSADHAEEIFQESVQGRPILLSSEEFRRTQRRDQRQNAAHRKVKPKPLNAHQRRSLGIYEIPKHQRHYALYVPLHILWKEYMSELCANSYDPNVIGEKLLKADFHGCDMSITRSTCPSRVGLSGICVKETRGTFTLITPTDELKVIPKEGTLFRIMVSELNLDVELYGSQFIARSADRASRKFKIKGSIDL